MAVAGLFLLCIVSRLSKSLLFFSGSKIQKVKDQVFQAVPVFRAVRYEVRE